MSESENCKGSRSFWERICDRAKYQWRRQKNEPMYFEYAPIGGIDVGYPMPVFYPSFHDMAQQQIAGHLTILHLRDGLQFNAYREVFHCRVGQYQNMSVVQPVLLGKDDEQEAA